MEHKDLQRDVVIPVSAPDPEVPVGRGPGSLPGVIDVAEDDDGELVVQQWKPVYCKSCKTVVTPEGRGKCPTCRRFLPGNYSTQQHPVRKSRREVLRRKLEAEYQPSTMLARETCRHLAATLERLEVLKPGSAEWPRLVGVAQSLGSALREARAEATPPNAAGLDFSHRSFADLAELAASIAEHFFALAIAERQGREEVAAAANELRAQQVHAAVEEQVVAASKGETPRPLPRWFTTWLEKEGQQP